MGMFFIQDHWFWQLDFGGWPMLIAHLLDKADFIGRCSFLDSNLTELAWSSYYLLVGSFSTHIGDWIALVLQSLCLGLELWHEKETRAQLLELTKILD